MPYYRRQRREDLELAASDLASEEPLALYASILRRRIVRLASGRPRIATAVAGVHLAVGYIVMLLDREDLPSDIRVGLALKPVPK